jgi:hypothetical protein
MYGNGRGGWNALATAAPHTKPDVSYVFKLARF